MSVGDRADMLQAGLEVSDALEGKPAVCVLCECVLQ